MTKKPREVIIKTAYWRNIGLNEGTSELDLILWTLGVPYNLEGCEPDW